MSESIGKDYGFRVSGEGDNRKIVEATKKRSWFGRALEFVHLKKSREDKIFELLVGNNRVIDKSNQALIESEVEGKLRSQHLNNRDISRLNDQLLSSLHAGDTRLLSKKNLTQILSKIVSKPEALNTNVTDDAKYHDLQAKSKTLIHPYSTLPIPLSAKEQSGLDEAKRSIEFLESNLIRDIAGEKVDYQGTIRAIWQDDQFVKALADPLKVKAILLRAQNLEEKELGNGVTLSSAIIQGLATNRPIYLATASPGFERSFNLGGTNPTSAKEDEVEYVEYYEEVEVEEGSESEVEEEVEWTEEEVWYEEEENAVPAGADIVRKVDKNYANNFVIALDTLQDVFTELDIEPAEGSMQSEAISEQIDNASVSELLTAFRELVNDNAKASALIFATPDNDGKRLKEVQSETYKVMKEYHNVVREHRGDHEAVLGYSLFSGALDARHLVATLRGIQSGDNIENEALRQGKSNLEDLLRMALSGDLDEKTTFLIKARLQQVLTMVVNDADKLGIKLDDVSKALPSTS